ncbi:branched-chain amino acid ABC transporter substrate-binding protein [Roseibium sp. MMSF_3544]|uniref:branched-chain amino acid ABC transporter substrate-binding protein n=1 Tax=unclassified Roseibium TaxID=2629323 RepID=UPI00273D3A0A|nr:branched-chain amino acid ABC transporter substrate-binding protein [Roseibium sp. MMSF_3544]
MTYRQIAACAALVAGTVVSTTTHADIAIAIAGPMEGQFRDLGLQMRTGAEQAVADINAVGGVNGEMLVLEIADDGCDADKAVAVANQLIGKGVVFVAGHFCFGASIPASEVYSEAGIVQISPATTLPKFTDDRPGKGTFRLAPRDDQQAQVAGQYLADNHSVDRIAFLHDKTAYGKGLVDAVKAKMNALGVNESLSLGFDAGEDDYRYLVSQLGLENVGVVFLGGYHPEAGLIKLELERQGLDTLLVSGDALMTDEFWAVSGPAGNGTLLTYPMDPRDVPEAASVVSALEGDGKSADRYVLTTYAAIQAWAQAAEQAGSTGLEDVAAVLGDAEFDTILGRVQFDGKGDSNLPAFVIYEWRDGAPRVQ